LDGVFNNPEFNYGNPALFNSGELCDSLMFPVAMTKIADKFEEQKRHKLVTLSKLGVENAKFLIQKQRKNTICSWSINSMQVAKLWEARAPDPEQRIGTASLVHDAGYEIRIRIDPIFPIEGWRQHYGDIAYKIVSRVEPSRIILGTPRGLWKTIYYAEKAKVDASWIKYFDNTETGWGKKLPFELRKEIYEYMFDRLAALGFARSKVSICKETSELLDAIGVEHQQSTCQCYDH
jgi:spore photoproduct lyase